MNQIAIPLLFIFTGILFIIYDILKSLPLFRKKSGDKEFNILDSQFT
jgi:hypothetical protein